ncbi:mitochondrial acidic protein MAM33-like isoform X2 [Lycium barbarum]|uniref:mitochondrial acidic protein MAM33-like isoform X2 n=1 Tax=Lycium barbarum TaxID=112863 RepID=UPI00293EB39F|nr:mitochondrial acidic protein MAM33-like isoform X2 [Lycium barbarum]
MRKVPAVLRQARKAMLGDLDLLKVLQSEINHELFLKPFQENDESKSFGDFVVDWDSTQSQDIVLRRRCESGEEIAVSALLGAEGSNENVKFPREAFMKVGVKKPGLRSILQFDCAATAQIGDGCSFKIHNVNYIPSCDLDSLARKGPSVSFFSALDQTLQEELYKYLEARGVGLSFADSLLLHLHKKEQGQYVDWLHKLQAIVTPSE